MKPQPSSNKLRYKRSQKLVLPVSQLEPGMYVTELNRPWEETPFLRLGKSIDTPAAKAVVSQAVDSVLENPDAMTLLTRLRNKDEYPSEHSLSVCLLSIALGRRC